MRKVARSIVWNGCHLLKMCVLPPSRRASLCGQYPVRRRGLRVGPGDAEEKRLLPELSGTLQSMKEALFRPLQSQLHHVDST